MIVSVDRRRCSAQMHSFCENAFRGPGPHSSSRRRPRGAKSRFGPLVDISCRMQRAAEDGTDPGAPWSYSGLRNSGMVRRYPIWCQNNFVLSLDLGGGHPPPMTRRTRPFAQLPARRFGHCAFGAQQERFWGRARSNRDRGTGAALALRFVLRSGDRLR